MGLIGHDDALVEKVGNAVYAACRKLGDHSVMRRSENGRGRWFEVKVGDAGSHVMRVTVELDHVESGTT